MIRLLAEAGPFAFPILLLALVILILTMRNAWVLLACRERPTELRRQRVDAVLFWGAVAAVLGFLGQWVGIHRISRIIAERGIVSPRAVSIGISESLLTPILGTAVLVLAGLFWFFLRMGLRQNGGRAHS